MKGLAAYSASRPQHSEGLAVFIASYLAHETALPNINLLHLRSRKAVQAALMMADVFPHIDFRREVTIGHLMLDINSPAAELAKVNPPIRPREDVEFLWQALLAGELDWVVSDHACCRHETKIPKRYFGNIWMAKSGFGGTEYLLPALVSEGTRRGMSYNHMAQVTSWNPAQRYGLNRKGDIARGLRRRHRDRRPGQDLDHLVQDLALDPGLHAVRGAGAVGAGGGNLPARPPDLPGRQRDRQAAGRIPVPPDGVTLMKQDSPQVVRSAQLPADAPQVAVAIVGAGACGLTAALMLADAGDRVRGAGARCRAFRLDRAVVGLHPGGGHAGAAGARHRRQPRAVCPRHPGQGPRQRGAAPGAGLRQCDRPRARCAGPAARPAVRGAAGLPLSRPQRRCACMRCPSAPARR